MPTLVAPSVATLTITTPGQSVPVTCAAGDRMMVEWEGPGGSSGSRLVLNETVDIGPLIDGTVVTFRALSGSPSYEGAVFAEVKTNRVTGVITSQIPIAESQIRLCPLGDSLMNRTHNTTSLANPPSYDPLTGVCTFTQTSHGHFTGLLCRITSNVAEMFDNLSLTRVDANTFSVNIGAGRTLEGTAWNFSILSAYHAEGPIAHLRPSRPTIYPACASGAKSADIKTKLLPVALASDANVVWLRAGTNDIPAGDVDATFADIEYMAREVVKAGKFLVLSTLPPYGSAAAGGAFTSNIRAKILGLSKRLANTRILDEHAIAVNPTSATGSAKAGHLVADNTHFTPLYAKKIGAALQAILDEMGQSGVSHCPASALDAYDAVNNPTSTQPFPNPTLITTTGGTNGSTTPITGTVGSGLTVYATGGFGAASVTASVVAASNGIGNAQRLVGAPTANNDLLRITTRAADSAVAGRLTAGERRKGVARVRVAGLTGQSVLQSLVMYVVFTNVDGTFSTRIVDLNWGGTAAQIEQADIERDLETGDFIVPAGVTSMYLDIHLKFAAAGTAVTFEASQFAFPLVA